MDVRTFGLALCALAALAMAARILWLFTNRVPVLAHSENTDALGDTMAGDPLNPPHVRSGIERLTLVNETDMRVEYEVGGRKYEHDLVEHSIEGLDITAPDDMPILWSDPTNPARVEARGPGFWVAGLFVVGLAAAAIFTYL